jgi:uncharacterized protein YfaS (alpha-2-macroglobulin family)
MKKIVLPIFLGLSLLLLSTSCSKKQELRTINPAFAAYIYACSGGEIGKTMPIRVRFTEAVAPKGSIGKPVESGIFSISPSVEGEAVWEDAYTIKLAPKNTLVSDKIYTGSVDLSDLYKSVPSKLSTFEFDFKSKTQAILLTTEGFDAENNNDFSKQAFTGAVMTADFEAAENVEKAFEASIGGSQKSVEWQHDDAGRKHQFTIKNIERTDAAQTLHLACTGSAISAEQNPVKEVIVLPKNKFSAIGCEVVSDEKTPYLKVSFSDPVSTNQDLTGMITVGAAPCTYTVNGNQIYVYTGNSLPAGTATLTVHPGIKNTKEIAIPIQQDYPLDFTPSTNGASNPQIELIGKGVIMPTSEGLVFPFRAVALKAIDVEVFKIYQTNVLQFLSTNELSRDGYDLERVGNIVLQKRIDLNDVKTIGEQGVFTSYALDLKPLIKQEPGAIYQIRIGFRKEYAIARCSYSADAPVAAADNLPEGMNRLGSPTDSDADDDAANLNSDDDSGGGAHQDEGATKSIMRYRNFNYPGYQYEQRDNPCFAAFYNQNKFKQRNVLASDLGITCKHGSDGSVNVTVADIATAEPMSGVEIEFYDRAQQSLGKTSTNGDGFAVFSNKRKPLYLIATHKTQKGYLKLEDGNALSYSKFEISGVEQNQKGMRGMLYGERGVWRPGDSLYLSFMLQNKKSEDAKKEEGAVHPVILDLYDPKGVLQQHIVRVTNEHGLYDLRTATPSSAPTGNWLARVSVGGAKFEKNLKIETVKPNRLKLSLDFGLAKMTLYKSDSSNAAAMQVNWLHGAPANGLKAKVEVELLPIKTIFKGYDDFDFDDESKKQKAEAQTVFDGNTTDKGSANVRFNLKSNSAAGKCNALITMRAFEKGGDMSFSNTSIMYSPYNGYVGIRCKMQNKQPYLDENTDNYLDLVSLTDRGDIVSGRFLTIETFKLDWRWWWDDAESEGEISSFNDATELKSIDKKEVTTNVAGKAIYKFKPADWGRYLIRVKDAKTGHSTSIIAYTGYGGGETNGRNSASLISFTAQKESYKVGDEVVVETPWTGEAKSLVSIENGSHVIKQFWTKTAKSGEKSTISFKATEEMAPNIYVYVSIIQAHNRVGGDSPLRLYGIAPVRIENANAQLKPMIETADIARPESNMTLKIKESGGKAMAYTIDIVDDGLLDLTNFKTPDPFHTFFAQEALGVKTWDLYDDVIGGMGGKISNVLSLGGDEAAAKQKNAKANRFKPVVMHLGPFYLPKGTATHVVKLPNYVGSVRAMVVASSENDAYGSAEKTVQIKKPLMVLATAPRVLSPGEIVQIPVDVFAMDAKVKDVRIRLVANDLFEPIGELSKNITFAKTGDEVVNFSLKVKEKIGIGKITVVAMGGGETATQTIELDVRNPNPMAAKLTEKVIQPGETFEIPYEPTGVFGTNEGILELSGIPSINFNNRLNYLLQYPHGCIEQTTSAAFPQLYANKVLPLSKDDATKSETNIKAGIERIATLFQATDGGFSYWPGLSQADEWGSSYAGHFLLEAQTAGYHLPTGVLDRWLNYQQKMAKNWKAPSKKTIFAEMAYSDHGESNDLQQAYRLYTLALAKKADQGAMNRLRESPSTSNEAKWRLAAAYAISGKNDVSKKLIAGLTTTVKPYRELYGTYGSDLRDEAMMLETLTLMGEKANAATVLKAMAPRLGSEEWMNTQTTAYSLLAFAKYVGDNAGSPMTYTYRINNGKTETINSTAGSKQGQAINVYKMNVDGEANRFVKVTNNGKSVLFAKVVLRGQPAVGDAAAAASNLDLKVRYTSLSGAPIDPKSLDQGTDLVAEVTVRNPGLRGNYKLMALSQLFPSGWEIHNSRLISVSSATLQAATKPDYQDIRDDRVYSYFNIGAGQTQVYRVQLNAAYQGHYFMPSVQCEAMYDNSIMARSGGQWIDVVRTGGGREIASADIPTKNTKQTTQKPANIGSDAAVPPSETRSGRFVVPH